MTAKKMEDWDERVMRVSKVYVFLRSTVYFLLTSLPFVLLTFLIISSSILNVLSLVTMGAIALIFLSFVYYTLSTISMEIILKPCKTQSIGSRKDLMPGKIIRKKGTITKHVDMISLERVSGCIVNSGIIGGIFDYGDIILTDNGKEEIRFRGVKSPERYLVDIQDTLDRMKGSVIQLQKQQEFDG